MSGWSGSPKSWPAGEVWIASTLNTEIRDRMIALAQHKHTGAAGDGAAVTALAY